MSLYDDWTAYLENPRAFESHHFEQLLFEDENYRSPERIFGPLSGGDAIAARVRTLVEEWSLKGIYFVAAGAADERTQRFRAEQHRDQLADFGHDEGLSEDAANLRAAPIHVSHDREGFRAMSKDRNQPFSDIPDLLSDIEIELISARDGCLFGAHAAILQLTKRPEVTSWVLAESLSLPVDLVPAYKLYRDGGDLLLCTDAIHLFVPASSPGAA